MKKQAKQKMKPQSSLEFDAFIAKQLHMSYGEYKSNVPAADREQLEMRFAAPFRKAARRAVGLKQADGKEKTAR